MQALTEAHLFISDTAQSNLAPIALMHLVEFIVEDADNDGQTKVKWCNICQIK